MDEYKEPYLVLFRACREALEAIDAQNFGMARAALIRGQQQAEELYITAGEDE